MERKKKSKSEQKCKSVKEKGKKYGVGSP